MSGPALSALVVAHDEEANLAGCLERLAFADEIVVVLDDCSDRSADIAARFTGRLVEGSWDIEGERRNLGIEACRGPWVLEVDADERVGEDLASEIREVIATAAGDVFDISVDNYIAGRLVRHGWMAAMGPTLKPSLFRKGTKTWGPQRVHPHLSVSGAKGSPLDHPLVHHAAGNISDLLRRLDRNTTWRAGDLRDSGEAGSFADMVRKILSRFWKCYVARKGYRDGGYGFVISLFSALYPLLAHLKATLEDGTERNR